MWTGGGWYSFVGNKCASVLDFHTQFRSAKKCWALPSLPRIYLNRTNMLVAGTTYLLLRACCILKKWDASDFFSLNIVRNTVWYVQNMIYINLRDMVKTPSKLWTRWSKCFARAQKCFSNTFCSQFHAKWLQIFARWSQLRAGWL